MLLPPLSVTGFLFWVVWDGVRFNGWFIVFACIAIGLWVHLTVSLRMGGAGLTAADAAARRFARAHGGIAAYDATTDLDRAAAYLDRLESIDARAVVPQLAEIVDQAAQASGLPAPERIFVEREGWSVASSRDGKTVGIGAAYLMVASLPEVAAELGRQFRLVGDREAHRRLRTARTLVTAAQLPLPDWIGRAGAVFAPARKASLPLEAIATQVAGATRAAATDALARGARPGTVETAAARAAVVPQLWREHLAALQRDWTAHSRSVAPHATWRDAWVAQPVGRSVSPECGDVFDLLTHLGWDAPRAASIAVPPIATPSALEVVAGADLAHVLRRLDDDTASIYFNERISQRFGAAVELDETEDASIPAASTPVTFAPEGVQAAPVFHMVAEQLDELELGLVRRDESALAYAAGLAGSDAPTVRALAAGVRWVSGDPSGAAAIEAAVRAAPRAAGVLGGLVGPLRNQRELATADLIESAIAQARFAADAPAHLTRHFGRRAHLVTTSANALTAAIARELLPELPSARRAWLFDLDIGTDPTFRPAALVVQFKTLDVRSFTVGRDESARDAAEVLQLFWPLTRGYSLHAMAPTLRRQVRRTPPIWQA